MTRSEAIAIITRRLAEANDATLAAIAEQLSTSADAVAPESELPRVLTARELQLIEQSKEDFAQERTFSIDGAEEYIYRAFIQRRGRHAKTRGVSESRRLSSIN